MKLRRAFLGTALTLALSLQASVSQAGTFMVTDVRYTVVPGTHPAYISVAVEATATYKGKLDNADDGWLIQTFLNDSIGWDLEDWENPDWWGPGNSGTGIPYSGYEVYCDLACAATGGIKKCDAFDDPVMYKGKAGVTIYHQFSPEIDIRYARQDETECLTYSVGGTVLHLTDGTKWPPLILENIGYDELEILESGAYTFPTELKDGDWYNVQLKQQPWGEHCEIVSGNTYGQIDGADIDDLVVECQDYCDSTLTTVPRPADYASANANCHTALLLNQGDGTVADVSNNLLWTRDVTYDGCIGVKYSSGGYYACAQLVLGGREDWRIPDIAQLQTLMPLCGGGMTGCDGLFWSTSHPPSDDCCPRGYGCGRCHWLGGFGSKAGTLQDGSVGWRDISTWCDGRTRCVTSLFVP